MNVFAVIPACNEEETISLVVSRTQEHVDRVIVIDDGSRDQTAIFGKRAGATVIRHMQNTGIGASLMTGYRYSLINGANVLVQLDGDGQHDPQNIPDMLDELGSGRDLVVASRYLDPASNEGGGWRDLGIQFYSKLLSLLTSFHVTDATSGFRALTAESLREARPLPTRHWAICQTYDYLGSGKNYGELPVRMDTRSHGKSQFSISTAALYHFRVAAAFASQLTQIPGKWLLPELTRDTRWEDNPPDEGSLSSELPSK